MAEVRARMTMDTSGFNAAIEGANKKAAKLFGKGFGAGKYSFMGFQAVSDAIESSNGSFKQFSKNLAATGLMAAGVIGIAKSWEMLGESINKTRDNLKEFGWEEKGWFGQLAWNLGFGSLKEDKAKRADKLDMERQDAISRAAKSIAGPDADERVLRWMRSNNIDPKNNANRIGERLRKEREQDDIDRVRMRRDNSDSLARIGLGIGYGGSADYARRTADNTEALVKLFQSIVGNPVFVPSRAG